MFNIATGQTRGFLPFEILVEDHRIAGWPWEFLYDRRQNMFVCQEFHPMSRVIFNLRLGRTTFPDKDELGLLVVVGVLMDDRETTAPSQIKAIEEQLKAFVADDAVRLEVMDETRPDEVIRRLEANDYDIFHFYGHAAFDDERKEGYLRFDQRSGEHLNWYANQVGQALAEQGIRLAFLNACGTAQADESETPIRSSVAAALLGRGIPAVIATQFPMPVSTADYFAALTYNALAMGKPVVEALRAGRQGMALGQESKFYDWGIPVLYASDPNLVIFPSRRSRREKAWARKFEKALRAPSTLGALASPTQGGPTIVVERTVRSQERQKPKVKVALVDLNARVGFLPELVEAANQTQGYYGFEVAYSPVPSGSLRTDKMGNSPQQLFLPWLGDYLSGMARHLDVQRVCCLTSCMIAGEENGELYWNRFAGWLPSSEDVFAITTFGFGEYAERADASFAKATLYLCLAMLVAHGDGGRMGFHDEIVGCLLDRWRSREDFLTGLRHSRFDHPDCRQKIEDQGQLEAIDRLLALRMDWSEW